VCERERERERDEDESAIPKNTSFRQVTGKATCQQFELILRVVNK